MMEKKRGEGMGAISGRFYYGELLEDKTCKKMIQYFTKCKFLKPNMQIEAVFGQFFLGAALGLVCTSDEVLYQKIDKNDQDMVHISYKSIASISYSQDMGIGTKIDIGMHGTDGVRLELTGKPEETDKLIRFLQEKSSKVETETVSTGKADSVNEIRRYFELKEQGIISAEEFEAKKKQLLGL